MRVMTDKPAETLDQVSDAYRARRDLAERLAKQDQYIGDVVRAARKAGNTWQSIADVAGTSDVAVLKAARRPSNRS